MIRSRAAFRPVKAQDFERAMVFIDGTNLFHRLRAAKLKIKEQGLLRLANTVVSNRPIVRTYLYTSPPHLERANIEYAANFDQDVRVVRGEAIKTKDGNYKEKGVDAMLVADLVYHAAVRNFEFAVLISVDTDFAQALRRVEDFGCRTAVVGLCAEVPRLLRETADQVITFDADDLNRISVTEPL